MTLTPIYNKVAIDLKLTKYHCTLTLLTCENSKATVVSFLDVNYEFLKSKVGCVYILMEGFCKPLSVTNNVLVSYTYPYS